MAVTYQSSQPSPSKSATVPPIPAHVSSVPDAAVRSVKVPSPLLTKYLLVPKSAAMRASG